jgi:hypothetical protein
MQTKSFFLAIILLAGVSSLRAQTIAHTVWKGYFADPLNDTIYFHFGNDTSFVSNRAGEAVARSTVKVSKDTLTITDYDGQYMCAGTGVYTYVIKDKELKLSLVRDDCQGRNAIADIKWIKVE